MRLATFNVENLFSRYRFAKDVDFDDARQRGFTADELTGRIDDPQAKSLTAAAILAIDADVLALQEVESMATLKRFRDRFLGGRAAYPHCVVLDGNDPRDIEVGVLSRFPIVHARSWQHLWDSAHNAPLFSRDCLEVDIAPPAGPVLTLYVNHFKSMRVEGQDGSRAQTRPLRLRQASAVMDIVRGRFGEQPGQHRFAIVGDFNDYLGDDEQGQSGIDQLVHWPEVVHAVGLLPPDQRWTHFWRGHPQKGLQPTYQQLDYVLLSQALARHLHGPPVMERRGQPGRAERFAGERFAGVGFDRPKASDHCPVAVDLGF